MTPIFHAAEEVMPFENDLEELLAALSYIDLRVRWAVVRARNYGLDPDDEFRGLYISEAQVDDLLSYKVGPNLWPTPNGQRPELEDWPAALVQARAHWQARTLASRAAGNPPPLDQLAQNFELSAVELDVLLIALAPELDPRYERLFAYLQDDVTKKRPSVDLVLNLLTNSFKEKLSMRRLFNDDGRLAHSRLLVRFADAASREPTLLAQYVRPAAPVVEHLAGHGTVDERLNNCARLVLWQEADPLPYLPAELAEQLVVTIGNAPATPPFFAFRGGYGMGKRDAAWLMARELERPLLFLDLAALAESEAGLLEGLRLALRDGRLAGAVLYLAEWDSILVDGRPPPTVFQLLLDYPNVVVVAGEANWRPTGQGRIRRVLSVEFTTPNFERRLHVWRHFLDADDLPLLHLANQFQFAPGQIADAVSTARDIAYWRGKPLAAGDLLEASRSHSNQKLAALATKIRPYYCWQDIVLPSDTIAQLHEMVNTVRQRPTVYGAWGFGRKVALGKGLNALFAGESGTGKTMAADIIAGELGQDLYKIDLSLLVSKYIGETEKNLNRVFTEAATSNAILFFDEADAIFGKRSEVKDSHDRYANIEISYLLQRMEAYDGVVILATNLRANLDEAFTRRLHFIVEFPFPEASDRERIWQVNFPAETPIFADVDFKLLAERFRLAGGNIRNIIMAAAFLAAESGGAVATQHLLRAARREYQKVGRLIDERLFVLDIGD